MLTSSASVGSSGGSSPGADQPLVLPIGVDGGGQNARNRGQRPVQRQLAQGAVTFQFVGWYRPHNRQNAQGDGQIEMPAFLQQIGGRQINRYALGRKRQTQ